MAAGMKSKKNKVVRDPAKEKLYRSLCEQLSQQGFTVRREKLKQGFGWKVVSGSCEALGQRMIFVDQRMSQDDQIAFLQSRLLHAPDIQSSEVSSELEARA
jgi:hypothetical protein